MKKKIILTLLIISFSIVFALDSKLGNSDNGLGIRVVCKAE